MRQRKYSEVAHPDPITGAPGAHPLGTGVGATAGSAAGAAAGSVIGPAGLVIGATIGAIAGGLAGKAVGEAANSTFEDSYWRECYMREPYYSAAFDYDDYAAAYRTGYEAFDRYPGKFFTEVEDDLERDFMLNRGTSSMTWEDARAAARAAWERMAVYD